MTAHQQLERQLRASVAQRAHRGSAYRSWPRSWKAGLPSALIIATTIGVTVGIGVLALVTLHHGPSPSSRPAHNSSRFGPPPKEPPGWQNSQPRPHNVQPHAIDQALNTAAFSDRACGPGHTLYVGPVTTNRAPSTAMLSALPALRRPSTPADQLPDTSYVHGWLRSRPADVYIRFVRRARVAFGASYYVVPAARLGTPPLSQAAAGRCYGLAVAALKRELPHLAEAKRLATLQYGEAVFRVYRYRLETSSVHEGVFLLAEYKIPVCKGPRGAGLFSCGEAVDGGQSPAAIERAGLLSGGRLGPPGSPIVLDGIVPAGVASVTLHFPARRHAGKRFAALNASANVVNDIFVIPVPTLFNRGWPTAVIWRAASGRVIKTVSNNPCWTTNPC